jgi:hypothetical protein
VIPVSGARVDLSETLSLTLELIETPWAWRQRLVETLELESGTEVRATSAYQIDFPPEMLEELGVRDAEWANVILPVTTRAKRPLLHFNIGTSHGRPAHLLTRRSNAGIEAQFVRALIENGPTPNKDLAALTDELLEAMFIVTPQPYEQLLEQRGGVKGLRQYLQREAGLAVSPTDVARWLKMLEPAAAALVNALEEPSSDLSSTENVLLALPELPWRPLTRADVEALVAGYVGAIAAAEGSDDKELLSAIAEYGRRWEMLVEVEVPLGRPTEIWVAEDRPLTLERDGWLWQRVAIGDAPSAHIQVSVPDPALELRAKGDKGWKVRALDGKELGLRVFDAARLTRDTIALYTSVRGRSFFVDVGFKLRASRYRQATAAIAFLVTLSAAVAALLITESHDLMERLAVLAIPTSIGATVVLVREQSGLATRVTAKARVLLALALLALWGVMVYRVLGEGVR